MEDLIFEERLDDVSYLAALPSDEVMAAEMQMMTAEQSWKDPAALGHVESPFDSHIAMIARRSEELGLVNEYSSEVLELKGKIDLFQSKMLSFDNFYQLVCQCPEDFGMSPAFVDQIFNANKAAHDHAGHDEEDHHHDDDEHNKKKKKSGRLSWFGIYFS